MAPSEFKSAREGLLEQFGFIHRAHRLYSSYGQVCGRGRRPQSPLGRWLTRADVCGLLPPVCRRATTRI